MEIMRLTNTYSRDIKIRVLRRELTIRERIYPIRVANGKMTQHEAEFEIDVLQAILKDYEE